MKYREAFTTDQNDVEKALQLLLGLIKRHQKSIEPALWVSATICALAENYENSEVPFEFFKKEIMECIEHYKY